MKPRGVVKRGRGRREGGQAISGTAHQADAMLAGALAAVLPAATVWRVEEWSKTWTGGRSWVLRPVCKRRSGRSAACGLSRLGLWKRVERVERVGDSLADVWMLGRQEGCCRR